MPGSCRGRRKNRLLCSGGVRVQTKVAKWEGVGRLENNLANFSSGRVLLVHKKVATSKVLKVETGNVASGRLALDPHEEDGRRKHLKTLDSCGIDRDLIPCGPGEVADWKLRRTALGKYCRGAGM